MLDVGEGCLRNVLRERIKLLHLPARPVKPLVELGSSSVSHLQLNRCEVLTQLTSFVPVLGMRTKLSEALRIFLLKAPLFLPPMRLLHASTFFLRPTDAVEADRLREGFQSANDFTEELFQLALLAILP